MFTWFKSREEQAKEYTVPEVKIPEKNPVSFYRIGLTDNQCVSFQMGYSEITMTKQGVQNMINMLAVARDQLADEDDSE